MSVPVSWSRLAIATIAVSPVDAGWEAMSVWSLSKRFVTGLRLGLLIIAMSGPAHAYVGAPGVEGIAEDLPEDLKVKVIAVSKSLDIVRDYEDDVSANTLGVICLAAAELYGRGEKRVGGTLRSIAEELIVYANDSFKKPAWGRPDGAKPSAKCSNGGFDNFGDGTCDPADTTYAFQSGLGMACLVRAGRLLGERKFTDFAERGMEYWLKRSMVFKECNGCRYFWSSDVAADSGRFVRNMNLFATLPFALTVDEDQHTRIVDESIQAEMWERAQGNRGYLGALDPQWRANPREADRIENHAAGVAVLLRGIYWSTKKQLAASLAKWNYDAWANCSNERCVKAGCDYWAGDPARCIKTHTFAHCAFRSDNSRARDLCIEALRRVDRLNLNQLLFVLIGDGPALPK